MFSHLDLNSKHMATEKGESRNWYIFQTENTLNTFHHKTGNLSLQLANIATQCKMQNCMECPSFQVWSIIIMHYCIATSRILITVSVTSRTSVTAKRKPGLHLFNTSTSLSDLEKTYQYIRIMSKVVYLNKGSRQNTIIPKEYLSGRMSSSGGEVATSCQPQLQHTTQTWRDKSTQKLPTPSCIRWLLMTSNDDWAILNNYSVIQLAVTDWKQSR